MTEHTLNGKSLSECSDDEISREWNAYMAHEACTDRWTDADDRRVKALEAEMDRRAAQETGR